MTYRSEVKVTVRPNWYSWVPSHWWQKLRSCAQFSDVRAKFHFWFLFSLWPRGQRSKSRCGLIGIHECRDIGGKNSEVARSLARQGLSFTFRALLLRDLKVKGQSQQSFSALSMLNLIRYDYNKKNHRGTKRSFLRYLKVLFEGWSFLRCSKVLFQGRSFLRCSKVLFRVHRSFLVLFEQNDPGLDNKLGATVSFDTILSLGPTLALTPVWRQRSKFKGQ